MFQFNVSRVRRDDIIFIELFPVIIVGFKEFFKGKEKGVGSCPLQFLISIEFGDLFQK